MHNTALTHLDGVATSVGAEAWGRRYIVVRVRRPRGGCSSGGAAAATLSLRSDEAAQHLTLISHLQYHLHYLLLLLSAPILAELCFQKYYLQKHFCTTLIINKFFPVIRIMFVFFSNAYSSDLFLIFLFVVV